AFLSAGRHPLRVDWFNSGGGFALDLEYEGPGLPRQKLAAASLSRKPAAPVERSGNFVPGLDYRCYEGFWERLPDFRQLAPVKNGVVPQIDLSVRSRDQGVGLEFTGFLQ